MVYVEWLRVRGCLKWTALALGVLLLICVVARIALLGHHDSLDWAYGLESAPGSTVTQSALPDGKRTVIDNPTKQMHVVIDDHGARGKHIEIRDYAPEGSSDLQGDHLMLHSGSINESKLPHGGALIVIDTNGNDDQVGFIAYVMFGLIVAFIIATVLGVPFARENDGHLEVALTKPTPRDRFGAMVLATDMAGIVAGVLFGIVFALAAQSLFVLPHVTFGARDLLALGVGIFAPLAWYAMLAAATASMKRGYGAVLGFAWPAAAVVLAFALARPDGNAVLAAVHGIAWALSFINPLSYTSLQAGDMQIGGPDLYGLGYAGKLLALVALTVFYAILSLIQWRRIEA